ncbi:MAG: hypothetical protein FVQ83_05465 [Chloroflexi bacterium]|nr:hypothetical protein [Chloroflexota bacterium]
MKILNYKEKEKKSDGKGFAGLMDQINNLLGGESTTSKSQDIIIEHLNKVLDNSYSLLLNYPLPHLDVEIPMILVGPSGMRVLYPFGQRGIYRAKEDAWFEMNDRKRKFEPGKENLVALTSNLAQAVHKYMENNGVNLLEIEPIMMFSDPGSHIDTARPVVRIVPNDAIEKFASSLLQIPAALSNEDIYSITALITRPPAIASQTTTGAESELYSAYGEEESQQKKSASSSTPEDLFGLGFSLNQWLVIGALLAGIFILFIGFALLLFFY